MESASTDFAPLRARLGRMLGLPEPLSEGELLAANLALTAIIEAHVPSEYIEQHRATLPKALGPLLAVHISGAWAAADTRLAIALETLHGYLAQPEAALATA